MANVEILQGSWHNSGFHGHFRSRSRSDFICEYRHLAKPPPPRTFLRRAKETATKHVFSKHDNRHSFLADAQYFEQGLGRRRVQNEANRHRKDLLTWLPDRVTFERGDPALSVYRLDYPIRPGADNIRQRYVRRPMTSFDQPADVTPTVTTYRYAHGSANPNRQRALDALGNSGLGTAPNRKQRASFVSGRESVATCLSWYVPPEAAARKPVATQTVAPPGVVRAGPGPGSPSGCTHAAVVQEPESTQ